MCIGFRDGDFFGPSEGDVHADGSCLFPDKAPLSRAGFACVQVDVNGTPTKIVYGCLPKILPQTSQAAEFGALSCAYDCSQGVQFVGDCANVVRDVQVGVDRAVLADNPGADTWRVLLHRYGESLGSRILGATKIEAHRDLSTVPDNPDAVRSFWGNHYADLYAKLGAPLLSPRQNYIDIYYKTMMPVRGPQT